ncbi:hypothetical protein F5051DRAFT_425861 [Lentinula edodes]|nr:hypothetical protein F5051DRAFT_425861 [Lentinula edodes]
MAVGAINLQAAANAPLAVSPGWVMLLIPRLHFLLAGAWVNLLLYTIELLVGTYFLFKIPGKHAKALVAVALLVDTISTISVCQFTWMNLRRSRIVANNSPKAIAEPFLLASLMSSLAATIEESYFAFRLWSITRSKITITILVILIYLPMTLVIASVGLAFNSGVAVDQAKLATLNIIASFMGAFTDTMIAVYLVYKLRTINALQFSYPTKCLIRKIITYTVACGLITALFTIATSVLAFSSVGPFLLFFDCNGRVYTLTILLNFITFHEWRKDYDEKRRSTRNDNDKDNSDFRWKGSTWSRRFRSSQSSTTSPRYPPSVLSRNRSNVSVMRTEIHGAVMDGFQKPVPGPPFSMESIFSKSEEELS